MSTFGSLYLEFFFRKHFEGLIDSSYIVILKQERKKQKARQVNSLHFHNKREFDSIFGQKETNRSLDADEKKRSIAWVTREHLVCSR